MTPHQALNSCAGVLQTLTVLMSKLTPYDGFFRVIEGRVNVARHSKPSAQRTCLLAAPSLCIVPQGEKSVALMQADIHYVEDASTMVVYAAEIPLGLQITKASSSEPYFCLMLPLSPQKIHELALRVYPNGLPKADKVSTVYVRDNEQAILKACVRLLELIIEQEHVDLLAPLVLEEIFIRLLKSPVGPAIAQIGVSDSHAEKVNKAITWLKDHYAEPVKMDDLARLTGMSVSSFHSHFKAITSMSPLQYQKTVRLQHARNLMHTQRMDVSQAAYQVGYASTSQFSREYTRAFGVAPSRDVYVR